MEPEIIRSMVASLPQSEMEKVRTPEEVWEEVDGAARIIVARHQLTSSTDGSKHNVVAVTVSGTLEERRRVIDEFVAVYGTAADGDIDSEDGIDTILWVVND